MLRPPTLQGRHLSPQRAGALHTLEFLLILPIVLALLLGMVEYSLILSVDQQLAQASREGARVAAQGGDAEEVINAVRLVLGQGRVGDFAEIKPVLTDENGAVIASGQPVEVVVKISDAALVVPDMLRFVGFSIRHKVLAGRTVMRKE